MGKILLIKPNFNIPLTYVAKEKTQCAKVFKTITANADEIPTKTADKNINCFGVKRDCAKAIIVSNLEIYFLNMIIFKGRAKLLLFYFQQIFFKASFAFKGIKLEFFIICRTTFTSILAYFFKAQAITFWIKNY